MKIYNIYKYSFTILFCVLLAFSACSQQSETSKNNTHVEGEDHDHGAENHNHDTENHNHEGGDHNHDNGGDEDIIVFSDRQAEMLGVEKQTIKPTTFYQVIRASGKILAAQGDEKTIVATTNGIVSLAKQGISEGATVRNGETVFSVSSKKIGEGDVAAKAKNLYDNAKREYDRAKSLIDYKLISEKEFNEIKLNYENAKLSYDALSGSVGGGINVSSPIAGFIKAILVSDGQYVSIGEPLAVVTQSNKLQLRADVSQKFYASLPNITSANIVLPFDNSVIKLSELNGKVISYGKSLEDNDFYMPINFSFNNIGNIVSGSYVEVYLLGKPKANSIVIPKTSLLDAQGDYFVIVNIHDDEYRQKRVSVGESDGENVEILNGLSAGEVVVSKGAFLVKQAKAGAEIPHGHTH